VANQGLSSAVRWPHSYLLVGSAQSIAYHHGRLWGYNKRSQLLAWVPLTYVICALPKGAKGAGRMRAPLHDLRYSSPEVRSAKPVLRVSTKAESFPPLE
jgi:hypothetical protein